MNPKESKIVKSILGDDIFEELNKFEIFKPETKTVVDPDEIKIALQIVPRSVLSYLFSHLKWMNQGESIDLDLPFDAGAFLHVDKKGNDNYHGELIREGKKIAQFQHRSLPSIGLILLTSLELYDIDQLDEIKTAKLENETKDKIDTLQDIIDERLAMNKMVKDVVDSRISEREAIDRLIREKLHNHIKISNSTKQEEEEKEENPMEYKKSKLKSFLENREKKRQEDVEIDKNEINCPDCGTALYKSDNKDKIKLCICYGDEMNKEIKLKRSENGKVKLKFPKSFDIENIEMLLDSLKQK